MVEFCSINSKDLKRKKTLYGTIYLKYNILLSVGWITYNKGGKVMLAYKDKWWYSTITILILSLFGWLIIPGVLAIIMLIVQMKKRKNFYATIEENIIPIKDRDDKIKTLDSLIEQKNKIINDKDNFIQSIKRETELSLENERDNIINKVNVEAEQLIEKANEEAEQIVKDANESLQAVVEKTTEYKENIEDLSEEYENLVKEVNRYKNQARKFKSEVTGLKNFDTRFPHTINFENVENQIEKLNDALSEDALLGTVIRLHLHSDNSKELRKLSRATNKEIQSVLSKYENRYTTKGNKTIYNLMIIGLQAEMQLLLFQLKYNKIDESIQSVKDIITKYLAICGSGNQSILPT